MFMQVGSFLNVVRFSLPHQLNVENQCLFPPFLCQKLTIFSFPTDSGIVANCYEESGLHSTNLRGDHVCFAL